MNQEDEEIARLVMLATNEARAAHPEEAADTSPCTLEEAREIALDEPAVFTFLKALVRLARAGVK